MTLFIICRRLINKIILVGFLFLFTVSLFTGLAFVVDVVVVLTVSNIARFLPKVIIVVVVVAAAAA
jgi:hypothetical protein